MLLARRAAPASREPGVHHPAQQLRQTLPRQLPQAWHSLTAAQPGQHLTVCQQAGSGAQARDPGSPPGPRIKLSVSKARKTPLNPQQDAGKQQQQQQQAEGVAVTQSAFQSDQASGSKQTRKRARAAPDAERKQRKRPAISHEKGGVTYLKDATLPQADHDRLMAQVAIIKKALGTDKKPGEQCCWHPPSASALWIPACLHCMGKLSLLARRS